MPVQMGLSEKGRMNSIAAKNLSALRKRYPAYHESIFKGWPVGVKQGTRMARSNGFELSSPRIDLETDFIYLFTLHTTHGLRRCVEHIDRGNRGMAVIEPDPVRFIETLMSDDLAEYLVHTKIFWAVGETWKRDLDGIWEQSYACAAAKPMWIDGGSRGLGDTDRETARILTELKQEARQRKLDLFTLVKTLPRRLAAAAGREPKRVWTFEDLRNKASFSTIQTVLIRNLLFGLRSLGYQTEYAVMRDGFYYPPYYRILRMAKFEPDIVFLCNQGPAYDFCLGAELSRSLPIPKVVWFADDPVYGEHLIKRHKITPDEHYLVADYEWDRPLLEHGAKTVHFMPGAVTKTRRGKKRGSRKCEIVFVGQVRQLRPFFASLSGSWSVYCEQVIREKLRFPRKKIREIMDQFPMPGELADDYLDELRQKLLWEANTRFRVGVIRALAGYDLVVYGNDDWNSFFTEEQSKRMFRGVLSFKHLFEAYRNAAITLNIHSVQSYTCMNVRDFDVPAAGGFLLSDWLPRANEVFTPGFVNDLPPRDDSNHEVFFYRNLVELKQLADYFLAHDDQRQACIERARARVVNEHTYLHRARQLDRLFRQAWQTRGEST